MKNEEKKMKKKVIASILAASKPQPAQRQEVRQMAQKHRI